MNQFSIIGVIGDPIFIVPYLRSCYFLWQSKMKTGKSKKDLTLSELFFRQVFFFINLSLSQSRRFMLLLT